MLNYRVAPELLLPFVPAGTELDLWNGAAYLSVVGFVFADTRVLGVPIPFHRTFEEVNLRLYVRRTVAGETRRGVTFIRELVPRVAIAAVARWTYNEPYLALPMRHRVEPADPADLANSSPSSRDGHASIRGSIRAEYEWRTRSGWSGIHMTTESASTPAPSGSHEEFITHRLWGYTTQRDGTTIEYEVRHRAWTVWLARTAQLSGDMARVYPSQLVPALSHPPDSALFADGSAVTVHSPNRVP